jgi:hypothetical protein
MQVWGSELDGDVRLDDKPLNQKGPQTKTAASNTVLRKHQPWEEPLQGSGEHEYRMPCMERPPEVHYKTSMLYQDVGREI